MPVKPIFKPSLLRNGLGTYVQPCHKVTIQYCNWGGSSKSIRDLLSTGSINKFASENLNIFVEVVKKSGHPVLKFDYSHDKQDSVEVRNKTTTEVLKLLSDYSQRSGNELFKYNHKVLSNNESVRGVWSPMHEHKGHRFKI
ncbi:39S ribosomal protein L51, mitochondrial [Yamadazyma tenuis]|uniref:Large ribosomal subunit protein mL43 n=1 Tax=Candida tenuis (strain ATCC 10573 / BCRC 21748 / CBS 615 / JCM 9827 / NBRC 10315 / NRRL Y-1498 / VKM Y-70) TaxID=590646 RepID=G3BA37_CANTC|nr:uncharacterized protein CANTEDRAFT_115467 [Yamadazyma tenuis ATCC 10573]EGV62003.1 hypothetical protein CANTEDRAFT_115467 [Yamadazyma tenuis ATCC 10573]WEJ93254.1 39S ribosomal protein L51, mitochondrial [Yamadazyma tenuis]